MYERRRIMEHVRPYPRHDSYKSESDEEMDLFASYSPVSTHSPVSLEYVPTLMDLMDLEIADMKEEQNDVIDARTELIHIMETMKKDMDLKRRAAIDFNDAPVNVSVQQAEATHYQTQSENKIRLYEFVLQLLSENKTDCIRWLCPKEGEFEITNSSKIAALWGQVKRNPNMTYEKFARALRHYYKLGILVNYKHKEKLRYKFSKEILMRNNVQEAK